jgi:hypothetical protein
MEYRTAAVRQLSPAAKYVQQCFEQFWSVVFNAEDWWIALSLVGLSVSFVFLLLLLRPRYKAGAARITKE